MATSSTGLPATSAHLPSQAAPSAQTSTPALTVTLVTSSTRRPTAASSARLRCTGASSAPTTAPASSVRAASISVVQHVSPVQSLAVRYATAPLPPTASLATQDISSVGSPAAPVLRRAAWTVTRHLAFPASKGTFSREGPAPSAHLRCRAAASAHQA